MGEEIRNCVKPGSGPVFFVVTAAAFFGRCGCVFSVTVAAFFGYCGCVFRLLRLAATALGTGGSFFNLYTTIFSRNLLPPTSCMFLIYILNVVGYRSSKQLVCAQPKRFLQYFGRFLSILRFRVVYRMQSSSSCAQPRNSPAHAACFPVLA